VKQCAYAEVDGKSYKFHHWLSRINAALE